uniref:STI1 domain-containing protein n=1 Tax=Fibrocapsa japonica TaxID=94617 RepID=A0A7S2UTT4_9STRA|mmetsp:Transcript_13010/g.19197  ORF Transcript_13010/g.19197 Transcript_13010/m.19197 type:complete len:219 (+) Transcript_13010:93-749(+)|eukprot:CAMPEP_0113934870 /NCGR_PEP_ID=MMETSP1339-20121228/2124_1 /TAXON_ID=94617 /ORGANISM="Fibrocapsa japonica" /LENGTH=218 /DNA_ID=CAMNT_0000936825 /DNA_START=93 /DNA_END=749 /DNA_ORIENTATION=+ /assembly_acc=CAM_ASM_000762
MKPHVLGMIALAGWSFSTGSSFHVGCLGQTCMRSSNTLFTGSRPNIRHFMSASDDEEVPVGEMKVSEIKAELELRKISWAGVFEKEELVRLLKEAREEGRADPSIVDQFNKQIFENRIQDDPDAASEKIPSPKDLDPEQLKDWSAGDGTLPGGLTPEAAQVLMRDPEIMAMLQMPKMQEVMKKVMAEGPSAMTSMMGDPEAMSMIMKLTAAMQKVAGQ